MSYYLTQSSFLQPVINSFSPLTGPTNTPVILTGNNFNSIATNNIVYFGTTKALVTNATVNSLNVVVPENANYQYISVTILQHS
ncbi:MAG: IPT/TIG domain-containing protein [Bacteroidetes bacterium]|nr:IPT/TIG domain-containing protein [Bacteroidota bacterium]